MMPVELESNWSPKWRRNDPSPAGTRVGCQRHTRCEGGGDTIWKYIGKLLRDHMDSEAASQRSMKL